MTTTEYISLKDKYTELCNETSDINEHLHTLFDCAKECESVLELGVRKVISSYAFAYGLSTNNSNKKQIFLNDIEECDITEFMNIVKNLNITVNYEWNDDLKLNLDQKYDIIFIDTWHVYAQLIRELKKFSCFCNKYLIMHDTTTDAYEGETLRILKMSANKQSKKTGFPVEEIRKGLLPAINEFLDNNNDWKIKDVFVNNNGLIILEKK